MTRSPIPRGCNLFLRALGEIALDAVGNHSLDLLGRHRALLTHAFLSPDKSLP